MSSLSDVSYVVGHNPNSVSSYVFMRIGVAALVRYIPLRVGATLRVESFSRKLLTGLLAMSITVFIILKFFLESITFLKWFDHNRKYFNFDALKKLVESDHSVKELLEFRDRVWRIKSKSLAMLPRRTSTILLSNSPSVLIPESTSAVDPKSMPSGQQTQPASDNEDDVVDIRKEKHMNNLQAIEYIALPQTTNIRDRDSAKGETITRRILRQWRETLIEKGVLFFFLALVADGFLEFFMGFTYYRGVASVWTILAAAFLYTLWQKRQVSRENKQGAHPLSAVHPNDSMNNSFASSSISYSPSPGASPRSLPRVTHERNPTSNSIPRSNTIAALGKSAPFMHPLLLMPIFYNLDKHNYEWNRILRYSVIACGTLGFNMYTVKLGIQHNKGVLLWDHMSYAHVITTSGLLLGLGMFLSVVMLLLFKFNGVWGSQVEGKRRTKDELKKLLKDEIIRQKKLNDQLEKEVEEEKSLEDATFQSSSGAHSSLSADGDEGDDDATTMEEDSDSRPPEGLMGENSVKGAQQEEEMLTGRPLRFLSRRLFGSRKTPCDMENNGRSSRVLLHDGIFGVANDGGDSPIPPTPSSLRRDSLSNLTRSRRRGNSRDGSEVPRNKTDPVPVASKWFEKREMFYLLPFTVGLFSAPIIIFTDNIPSFSHVFLADETNKLVTIQIAAVRLIHYALVSMMMIFLLVIKIQLTMKGCQKINIIEFLVIKEASSNLFVFIFSYSLLSVPVSVVEASVALCLLLVMVVGCVLFSVSLENLRKDLELVDSVSWREICAKGCLCRRRTSVSIN